MNWISFIFSMVCSAGVGIYLAWRCSDCRRFWAIIDIVWVSCGIVAIGFVAVEYTRAVKKVSRDIAIHNLARIKDSIKIDSYGIRKLYCTNHARPASVGFKRYCGTIDDVIFYTSLDRMSSLDTARLSSEIEKNSSTVNPPTLNNSLTLDLNSYSRMYESNKEKIEADITQPQFDSLVKLAFYVGLIIPLGLRIGRSFAELFRELRNLVKKVATDCDLARVADSTEELPPESSSGVTTKKEERSSN